MLDRHVVVRNRITWEREKGRGAKSNWKNASEDIWFATVSKDYHFNVEAVELKRRVLAPYRENGHVTHFTFAVLDVPKDQERGNDTHSRKVIVVPFDGAAFDRDLRSGSPR